MTALLHRAQQLLETQRQFDGAEVALLRDATAQLTTSGGPFEPWHLELLALVTKLDLFPPAPLPTPPSPFDDTIAALEAKVPALRQALDAAIGQLAEARLRLARAAGTATAERLAAELPQLEADVAAADRAWLKVHSQLVIMQRTRGRWWFDQDAVPR